MVNAFMADGNLIRFSHFAMLQNLVCGVKLKWSHLEHLFSFTEREIDRSKESIGMVSFGGILVVFVPGESGASRKLIPERPGI